MLECLQQPLQHAPGHSAYASPPLVLQSFNLRINPLWLHIPESCCITPVFSPLICFSHSVFLCCQCLTILVTFHVTQRQQQGVLLYFFKRALCIFLEFCFFHEPDMWRKAFWSFFSPSREPWITFVTLRMNLWTPPHLLALLLWCLLFLKS